MLQRASGTILVDRCITSRQLAVQLSVSNGSAMAIIDAVGYSKVCARWVPRNLTTERRRQRKDICSELLERFDAEDHPQSSRKKRFKTTPSAGKVMITVYWDIDGVTLVDVMARGETVNSDAYIKALKKLKRHYRRVQPNKNLGDMLIQHDTAHPHTSLRT
jgi:hypothetical protein